MGEAVAMWTAPTFVDSVELKKNEIGPVIVGLVIVGVVGLGGLGYGAYCTASGGNFTFRMSLKSGVDLSCTR